MEKVEITKEFFDSLMKDRERLNFIECYRVTIIEDKPGENGGFELSHCNGGEDPILCDLVYSESVREGIDRMMEYQKEIEKNRKEIDRLIQEKANETIKNRCRNDFS